MTRIGAHLNDDDPLAAAQAIGAEAVQFFLGDPQGWKAPTFPGGDPDALRDAFAEGGGDVSRPPYYPINRPPPKNRNRIPGRKLLDQQPKAAAKIGAKG